jgi:hypothetical protein
MVSNLELFSMLFLVPALFLVLAYVAKENRHKFPRLVLFFFSAIFLAIGLLCFIFTYQDFTQNQVSLILLKHSAPFSKFDSPKTFIIGLVLNFVFALLLAGGGGVGIFKSITNINFRFKK